MFDIIVKWGSDAKNNSLYNVRYATGVHSNVIMKSEKFWE